MRMRAWYHNKLGFSAYLCQTPHRESTRLIVRSTEHALLHLEVYPTWEAAVAALLKLELIMLLSYRRDGEKGAQT